MRARKFTLAQRAEIDQSLKRTGGNNDGTSRNATTVAHHRVVEVVKMVDAGGAVELNAEYRDDDQKHSGKRRGGPRSKVTVRQYLILSHLLALDSKAVTDKALAGLLLSGLSPKSLELIGLDPSTGTERQWKDRIGTTRDRHWLKPMDVERLDPSVGGDRRKRQVRRDYDAMRSRLDPEVEAEKAKRLNHLMNLLVDPTIDLLPPFLLDSWEGHTGIDATPVLYEVARGNRTKSPTPDDLMCVMPNGNYYKDTLNHGGDLHTIVAMPNTPYANDEFPRITIGVSFDRCGTKPGEVGLRAYESLQRRRYPVRPKKRRLAIVDGGYFPNPKPESFQIPMWQMGIDLVGTYGLNFLGVKGSHKGYLLVEGDTVCPYTPEPLLNAAVDFYKNKTTDADTFHSRLVERARYASRTHETRANGDTREKCPAMGPGKTVNCTHCPSATGKDNPNLPTVNAGPKTEVCGKTTVVPVEITGKYRQGLRWKTPEYRARFKSIRSGNESANKSVKTGTFGIHIPSIRKIRSMAGNFFHATLAVVANNFHLIDTHLRDLRAGTSRPPHEPESESGWGVEDDPDPGAGDSPRDDQNPNAPPAVT